MSHLAQHGPSNHLPDGEAVLWYRGCCKGTFFVDMISAGGVRLRGEPGVPRGGLVRLAMSLHGCACRLSVVGQVRDVAHGEVRIGFPIVSADEEDELHDALLGLLAGDHAAAVLVFDPRDDVRARLVEGLAGAGFHTLAAASGAEALDALNADEPIDALVVGAGVVERAGLEVVEAFVRRRGQPVVVVADPDARNPGARSRLADLAREVLPEDCGAEQVAACVGACVHRSVS